MQRIPEDVYQILTKTIIPALIAVSVGIAVKMKRKKITLLSAFTSYIIGIGFAFIFGFVIHENFEPSTSIILVSTIAITGEKIGYWIIFKFKFDALGDALMDAARSWISKK